MKRRGARAPAAREETEATKVLIEARNLTKYYNKFLAVDRVGFSIDRGEIVGLLGPNGAGKTTTMRMLACYLPPTEGSASVAGYDVMREPMAVRRHIGYMPENNPLYGEIRVGEYLRFRAELKGIARRRRLARVGECMEMCGVADMRRRTVRTLSKGYRQRVGLADALLGEPDVLILDEPTIGLDPNQIRHTREAIRQLGQDHTILLSTHILQEVEALCGRVLIINRGRIVVDDSLENLRRSRGLVAELKGDAETIRAAMLELGGVEDVQATPSGEWTRLTLTVADEADVAAQVSALAAARGWPLRALGSTRPTLEEVFYRITAQQDAEAPEPQGGQEAVAQ
ncbi:MAG: ATP-binding cassette domain-containing protein [Candidatus Brocadiia bacterium]|nr:ATP-binding cassette domain-containing protein [Candidatus Brocadiia bacterium]